MVSHHLTPGDQPPLEPVPPPARNRHQALAPMKTWCGQAGSNRRCEDGILADYRNLLSVMKMVRNP
ncbi:hypothetical protein [Bradyrhizobium sp. 174]|uniref:hypothetical protein n=1 Tax=Bradyrhizobium sp. 174 TaxID=2782645 RepID=UPI001FFB33D2|nr:hypothetical protein [Bradyrhizobium sp. 174]MCK1577756.1 hypothetical protein [Bradyrhizobium sp. 174]